MNLDNALDLVSSYLAKDVPVMLTGAPGVGKTEGLEQQAEADGYACLTESLATMESVDLRGLPGRDGNGGVTWSKPDFLVRLDQLRAESGRDVVLFIDEVNTNAQSVQVPLMQLARRRAIGPHALPEGTKLVFAGNRTTDRAAAQRMGTALNNRMAHVPVDTPDNPEGVKSWARWAAANKVHPMGIAFLMLRGASRGVKGETGYQPGLIHNFDPQSAEPSFPSPRSWAEAFKFCDEQPGKVHGLVAGLVGKTAADEFEGFRMVYTQAPSIASILAGPDSAPIPSGLGVQYAVALALGNAASPNNFGQVLTYMDRMGPDMAAVTLIDAVRRTPAVQNTPAFINWQALNPDVLY